MRILPKLSRLAVCAFLIALSPVADADWTSNFTVGAAYSGIVDIGPLGARKQLVLPPNDSNWELLASGTHSLHMPNHITTSTRGIDVRHGDLVFGNVVRDGQLQILLVASATTEPVSEVVLPDVCPEQKGVYYQNRFRSFTSARKPRCVTIETGRLESLSEIERKALSARQLRFSGQELVRVTLATSDKRYGILTLRFTTAVDADDKVRMDALVQWADGYAEQLEDALSRSLDEPQFKKPFPVGLGTAGDAVSNTGGTTPAPAAASQSQARSAEDVLMLIEKLKGLKDRGAISEEDFNSKKAELLKRL